MTRLEWLEERIGSWQRVLHVGCCDDTWHFDETWDKGQLLHPWLEQRCGELVGIDINDRVQAMRDLGYDVRKMDVQNMTWYKEHFNVAVLGDASPYLYAQSLWPALLHQLWPQRPP